MKRTLVTLAIMSALVLALALPASAHVIVVTHPATGEQISTHQGVPHQDLKDAFGADIGWVGGPGLPGQGKALLTGSPLGTLSPAHGDEGGLTKACERDGSDVVTIFGPPFPQTCQHG